MRRVSDPGGRHRQHHPDHDDDDDDVDTAVERRASSARRLPGAGVASATVFTFLFATPPSGGVPPYTFAWNFGDGGAGAGSTPSHAVRQHGQFHGDGDGDRQPGDIGAGFDAGVDSRA